MNMPFVLRTDKLSKPHFLTGFHKSKKRGFDIAISGSIFNALNFETKKDAKKTIKRMADLLQKEDWSISETWLNLNGVLVEETNV